MEKRHLLVFRFSSLGDVAMTVPVLQLLLKQHPRLELTMVSTEFMRPLFDDIERLHFHAADLKGKHKGVAGLFQLFKELKNVYSFDGIADLHNVLRTKILKGFFSFSGKCVNMLIGQYADGGFLIGTSLYSHIITFYYGGLTTTSSSST